MKNERKSSFQDLDGRITKFQGNCGTTEIATVPWEVLWGSQDVDQINTPKKQQQRQEW